MYQKELRAKLKKEIGVKNVMEVPKVLKIVVNMGIKDALSDKKNVERATIALASITGQKPKVTKAKKSIAAFKLREGDQIGVAVTLREKRMYDFLQKLIYVVLPRLRDFHGIPNTSFDGQGNYSLGFSEFTVFPEIDPGRIEKVQGMEISIVTTAKNNTQGLALLTAFGMPFIK